MPENFHSYLSNERRYSKHTVQAYLKDVEQFQEFLSTELTDWQWKEVNHHDIRGWVLQLLEANVAEKSVNRKLSSLKTFFNYLCRKGLVANNPASLVTGPKVPKRLPSFVEEQNLMVLLDELKHPESYKEMLALVIIDVLYATGIRLSELIKLKEEDIEDNSIRVTGKGNKQRVVPLLPLTAKRIDAYREFKTNQAVDKEAYLFLTEKGNKLYPKLVYRLVNLYLASVTTLSKRSPHILRHSFATHILNNGAELNAVKDLLGHAGLASTQVYTHNTIEKLRKSYKTAHPRAKK